jgi:hypothetical protein
MQVLGYNNNDLILCYKCDGTTALKAFTKKRKA